MTHIAPKSARGMTLIDVVVGSALVLIIFVALYGLLRLSIALSNLAANTMAASAIASDRMETIRALPYEALSTGQDDATTTENNVPYGVHTVVTDVDDPADGIGEGDADGSADYKRVIVTVSFPSSVGPRAVSLATYIASSTPLDPQP